MYLIGSKDYSLKTSPTEGNKYGTPLTKGGGSRCVSSRLVIYNLRQH
jgi:hypothetical protein